MSILRSAVLLIALVLGSFVHAQEIHKAAYSGDLEKVKALLEADPQLVFSRDPSNRTPLHEAAQQAGHRAVVELLLASKADVNARDDIGDTPLHEAAQAGDRAVVELLLANKADLKAKGMIGTTPLHRAVESGSKDVVKLLLASGADANAKDGGGMTPLHWTASLSFKFTAACHKDVAELLLASNGDVNAKDDEGRTTLALAAERGCTDIVELMLTHHADVNTQDNAGHTPLMMAAWMGHTETVELLLANKAAVNAKDKMGDTPLHWAVTREVAELLLASKADVNAADDKGWTPLDGPVLVGNKDLTDLLRQHGASLSRSVQSSYADVLGSNRFLICSDGKPVCEIAGLRPTNSTPQNCQPTNIPPRNPQDPVESAARRLQAYFYQLSGCMIPIKNADEIPPGIQVTHSIHINMYVPQSGRPYAGIRLYRHVEPYKTPQLYIEDTEITRFLDIGRVGADGKSMEKGCTPSEVEVPRIFLKRALDDFGQKYFGVPVSAIDDPKFDWSAHHTNTLAISYDDFQTIQFPPASQ